jgi:hypothetical protein
LKDFDVARLTFNYPARRGSFEEPSVQFGLVCDDRGQAPEVLAAELIESMRKNDPKSIAEMIGGSRDAAEKLGLVYRSPSAGRSRTMSPPSWAPSSGKIQHLLEPGPYCGSRVAPWLLGCSRLFEHGRNRIRLRPD